jgi:hypothetical protein
VIVLGDFNGSPTPPQTRASRRTAEDVALRRSRTPWTVPFHA